MREARRFLEAGKKLETRIKDGGTALYISGCKESGAVRRASMDLSRALADLRKSN